MAELALKYYGDKVLRAQGKPIKKITDDIKQLANDMIETVQAYKGVGLAAQQIGRTERLIVVDLSALDENEAPYALLNPEIVTLGSEEVKIEEGCLSFPDLRFEVGRPKFVKVRATNIEGDSIEIEDDGFLARVLQHEIDHINGKLFIDHLHPLKRKFILKQWQKEKKT